MGVRYRVECARVGKEHRPGLVGDFDTLPGALAAGFATKRSDPASRVTVTTGTDEGLNEYGHSWVPSGTVEEISLPEDGN